MLREHECQVDVSCCVLYVCRSYTVLHFLIFVAIADDVLSLSKLASCTENLCAQDAVNPLDLGLVESYRKNPAACAVRQGAERGAGPVGGG